MKAVLIIYLAGCILAARYCIQDICEDRKRATLSELAFILLITVFSWIGVLALTIGWNIKNNKS